MMTREELIGKYDQLAYEYAERFCDEIEGKPFDRHLLQRFAEAIPVGTVCDMGCGPGHIAAHLESLNIDVFGVDLSPRMIDEARRRYPFVGFQVGDMLDLKIKAQTLGGIVALYSIIHLGRDMLRDAFQEFNRVLLPGGLLLVSFHKGQGELHEDGVLDTQVSFDCALFEPEEVELRMDEAGFSIVETTVRRPYDIEYPTHRVYVLADKRM
ncbi:MAG TPA: class I SAM-dependent methyltransferase [Desulfobacterales bacterium]|nr:class I SAM-dependent methyltransferase [Desulfobacterales bacterium]